ncbi:MAG: hypothetical protein AB7G28_25290 [Pirellulales bacterium]
MKAVINCVVFTAALLWTVNALGQGTCHNNGGNVGGGYDNGGYGNGGYDNGYPNGQPYPADPYSTGATAPYYGSQPPIANLAPTPGVAATPVATSSAATPLAVAASAQHSAKITVLAVNSAVASTSSTAKSATSSGNLKIVADEPVTDERIAQLAGTWKAVARRSAGELTTIELVLDNRGHAELTVPGSDGKPSTTKSRANLENDELRLTGTDKVVSLGKLVDVSDRQMVLQLTEGTMTFVRL